MKRKLVTVGLLTAVMLTGCNNEEKKMEQAKVEILQNLQQKYNKEFDLIDLRTYQGGLGSGDTKYFGYAYPLDRSGEEASSTFYVEINGSYNTMKDQYGCMLLQRSLNDTLKSKVSRECDIVTIVRTDYDFTLDMIRINSQTVLMSTDYYWNVTMIVPYAVPTDLNYEVDSLSKFSQYLAGLGFKGNLYVTYSEPDYVGTLHDYYNNNMPSDYEIDYAKCPVDVSLDFAQGGDHSAETIRQQLMDDLQ